MTTHALPSEAVAMSFTDFTKSVWPRTSSVFQKVHAPPWNAPIQPKKPAQIASGPHDTTEGPVTEKSAVTSVQRPSR